VLGKVGMSPETDTSLRLIARAESPNGLDRPGPCQASLAKTTGAAAIPFKEPNSRTDRLAKLSLS